VAQITKAAATTKGSAEPGRGMTDRRGAGSGPAAGKDCLDELLHLVALAATGGQFRGGDHRVAARLSLTLFRPPRQWPQHRFHEVVHEFSLVCRLLMLREKP